MLKKIISGFQTGVDIAAIRAASAFGLQTGGAMPGGFLTLKRPRPKYAQAYGAYELLDSTSDACTCENLAKADATIILTHNVTYKSSAKPDSALKNAWRMKSPFLHVDSHNENPRKISLVSVGSLNLPDNPYQRGAPDFDTPQEDFEDEVVWLLSHHETVYITGNGDVDEAAAEEWLSAMFSRALPYEYKKTLRRATVPPETPAPVAEEDEAYEDEEENKDTSDSNVLDENILLALTGALVEPDEFWKQWNQFHGSRYSHLKVVAFQMSQATQKAIIRRVMPPGSKPEDMTGGTKDGLTVLFKMPVQTAEVPFGMCRFVVEWTYAAPAIVLPGE